MKSDEVVEFTARDFTRKTLYHSPQTPGYTCWVSLWQMPDETVMTSFVQATGSAKGRPRADVEVLKRLSWPPTEDLDYDMTALDMSIITLQSRDGGESWDKVNSEPFESPMNGPGIHGVVALPDGTVIRTIWGYYWPYSNWPKTGFLQRSKDGARSWGAPELFLDDEDYLTFPTGLKLLRDGRLALFAGVVEQRREFRSRRDYLPHVRKMFFVSEDEGRTWSPPIDVAPGPEGQNSSEESAFVELAGGDLFFLHRCENYRIEENRFISSGSDRRQNILKKEGATWSVGEVRKSDLPHGGFPELIITEEGLILNVASEAVYYSGDNGDNWHRLCDGTGYYPRALRLPDDRVLCVYHCGGDNAYGKVDQSIGMCTFRLEKKGGTGRR